MVVKVRVDIYSADSYNNAMLEVWDQQNIVQKHSQKSKQKCIGTLLTNEIWLIPYFFVPRGNIERIFSQESVKNKQHRWPEDAKKTSAYPVCFWISSVKKILPLESHWYSSMANRRGSDTLPLMQTLHEGCQQQAPKYEGAQILQSHRIQLYYKQSLIAKREGKTSFISDQASISFTNMDFLHIFFLVL